MRLMNVHTKQMRLFQGDDIPPYAILSHTWLADHDEVTFAQIQTPGLCWGMLGFRKIEYLCWQAASDGIDYAWIDTCCIDKTNSAELSEAINSMFHWYFNAEICYVYLVNAYRTGSQMYGFLDSRWWNRSWTLQELVASPRARFYDRDWTLIGSKAEMAHSISLRTRIDEETLQEPQIMHFRSVAQRMSWAAQRVATRPEDQAYSLIGIFGISMTMQYGEGENAFVRLQQEILRSTNDLSLFAWGLNPKSINDLIVHPSFTHAEDGTSTMDTIDVSTTGIFANLPTRFAHCNNVSFHHRYAPETNITELNGAFRIDIPLIEAPYHWDGPNSEDVFIWLIPCGIPSDPGMVLGIILQEWASGDRYQRIGLTPTLFTVGVPCITAAKAKVKRIWVDNMLWQIRYRGLSGHAPRIHRCLHIQFNGEAGYTFEQFIARTPRWIPRKGDTNVFTLRGTEEPDEEFILLRLKPPFERLQGSNTGRATRPEYGLQSDEARSFSTAPEPDVMNLYVALQLSGNPPNILDKVLVYNASVRLSFEAANDEIRDVEQALRRLPGPSNVSVHRDLRATISTQRIFNQVVSTLELSTVETKDDVHGGIIANIVRRISRFRFSDSSELDQLES